MLKTACKRYVYRFACDIQSLLGYNPEEIFQIVDLKPGLLQASSRTITAPFRPTLLLRSDPIPLKRHIEADDDEADTAYVEPLAMTTGQVVLAKNSNKKAFKSRGTETIKIGEKEVTVDDRTKKFFCGKDWHDAAENCRTPCPNGQTKECEDGDKCYADTNCDYWEWKDAQKDNGVARSTDCTPDLGGELRRTTATNQTS